MFKPKTFAHICSAMQTGAIIEIDGDCGYVNKIEKEDGGGYGYIVTLCHRDLEKDPIRKFIRVES